MFRHILWFFVFIFSVLPVFGAGADSVPWITPQKLNSMLTKGEDVLILDVRIGVEEKDLMVIKGAIRKSLIEIYRGEGLPVDMDKEIVIYCGCPDEETSASFALVLMKKGYTRVSALEGGFNAWVKDGYPLERR